jgi:gliding motility-associated-like protein
MFKKILFIILTFFSLQNFAQNSLLNGLILCYPFNQSYNDAAGNGYHAGKNSTVLVNDRFGRESAACAFDGQTSYIEINPTPFKIELFTISIWLYINEIPLVNKPQFVWSAGSNNGEQSIILEQKSGKLNLKVGGAVSETENVYAEYSSLNTRQWHHIVMLRDPNNLYLFVDGVQASSQPNIGKPAFYGTDFPRIYMGSGKRTAGLNTSYFGLVDDVHIYGRILNSFEIKKLFEGEKPPEIELAIDNKNPCGGDLVKFNVKGANASANYLWRIGEFNKEVYQNTFEFETTSKSDDYDLPVSVEIIDEFSCFPQKPVKVSDLLKIRLCSELVNLSIPNIFTPNNDGINDTWQIPNLDRIPEAIISVFDRKGSLVYSSKGYKTPWDGTTSGKNLLPADTYNYSIITKIKGEKVIKGLVLLIR